MFINILSNAKLNSFRVYSIRLQNKKFIDKKFDKLYKKTNLIESRKLFFMIF